MHTHTHTSTTTSSVSSLANGWGFVPIRGTVEPWRYISVYNSIVPQVYNTRSLEMKYLRSYSKCEAVFFSHVFFPPVMTIIVDNSTTYENVRGYQYYLVGVRKIHIWNKWRENPGNGGFNTFTSQMLSMLRQEERVFVKRTADVTGISNISVVHS